jgi:ABC-type antimicrobial peptide transport system permease subunit
VGRVVLPALSEDTRCGVGVFMTMAGEQRLIPAGVTAPPPSDLLLRFAPRVERRRMLAEVRRQAGDYTVFADQKPTDVVNFGQVQGLPLVLAALLALLAAATLANTLVTSVRRRRRDLAIMKTLGFSPRQVRGAVGWQATTLASLASLIGVPVGVFAGRWAWRLFADQLGTVPEPSTPGLALVITVAAVIALANVVAAGPGFAAARTRPALVLRAE